MLKRTLLAALALAGAVLIAAPPTEAAAISTATTTAVLLAPVNAKFPTRVFAYGLTAAGATTVKFVYGTQVTNPCDTGQTALTGAMAMATNGYISAGDGVGAILRAPQGQQVCLVQTGTVQLSGFVTIGQP